jgi:DEAD/DEAH box helicase domain-containing protein
MVDDFVGDLKRSSWYRGQIVHSAVRPGSTSETSTIALPEAFHGFLEARGIALYRHQAEVIEAFRNKNDVIITTPTASGKTLAFNLPILEALHDDPNGCALYLYPLKALANDQLHKLHDIESACNLHLRPATYDGDTPSTSRNRIKRASRIVLTNPHALHQYLPWHHQWARIFANLRALVIDEAHHYRGVYGSNVAFLLRRLLRIVAHYGGTPRVILSSASVANPEEFARALTGRDAVSVRRDGSGRGEKRVLFWDPSAEPSRSVSSQVARLLVFLADRGIQTICFTRTRVSAEVIAQRATRAGAKDIVSYRAGYLPNERRALEQGLREGTIRGVVSTTALEAGIDIGGLDAAILVGFPGSLLSAWQQAGRAGRGSEPSHLIFVPFENPLDRYFFTHPEEFLGQTRERLVVPLSNPHQQAGHLACAAAELPLPAADLTPTEAELARGLCEQGLLAPTPRGYIYRGLRRAHEIVSLDDPSGETLRMRCADRLLETMDPVRARRDAFPGAVYLHRGDTYVVDRLDLEQGLVEVHREDTDYHTQSLRASEVEILSCGETRSRGGFELKTGRVRVTESFLGYRTIHADRAVSVRPLDLPPHVYETDAVWIAFRGGIPEVSPELLLGSLHGAEHALIAMAPLLVLCDATDVSGLSAPIHSQTQAPTIVLFDDIAEGAGLTHALFDAFDRLAKRAHALVRDCSCEAGCPACLLSPRCGSQNEPLFKPGAIRLLAVLARGTTRVEATE